MCLIFPRIVPEDCGVSSIFFHSAIIRVSTGAHSAPLLSCAVIHLPAFPRSGKARPDIHAPAVHVRPLIDEHQHGRAILFLIMVNPDPGTLRRNPDLAQSLIPQRRDELRQRQYLRSLPHRSQNLRIRCDLLRRVPVHRRSVQSYGLSVFPEQHLRIAVDEQHPRACPPERRDRPREGGPDVSRSGNDDKRIALRIDNKPAAL